MTFSRSKCVIRKIYCGDGPLPQSTATVKYSRKGTTSECLRRGFGAAAWAQKKGSLSRNNLQQISYIGPVYEKNFKKLKITTILKLLQEMAGKTAEQKKDIIIKACTRKNKTVDHRAVNSVILYLHDHNISDLPNCRIVKE